MRVVTCNVVTFNVVTCNVVTCIVVTCKNAMRVVTCCNVSARYWGATVVKLDGSPKKFVGFVTLVGSSEDGPVPPIRILSVVTPLYCLYSMLSLYLPPSLPSCSYESSTLLRDHELRISSCFPIVRMPFHTITPRTSFNP